MKELSPEDQAVVRSINRIVQKQLGQPVQLPDRALRGERGLLLAALSPAAVAERLGNWVACCGAAFVSQLMVKEPCLLAHEPQVREEGAPGARPSLGAAVGTPASITSADDLSSCLLHELLRRWVGHGHKMVLACGLCAHEALRLTLAVSLQCIDASSWCCYLLEL
jgi:hypothetical protein